LTRFDDVEGRPEIELGYRLAREFWGAGLATDAARTAPDHAFQILGLRRLIALIDPENLASIRVAEKVHLRFEKEVGFRGRSPRLYAVDRTDLAAPNSAPTQSSGG
jgi:RimJ/RimL family protein N-acetyltransferase